MFEYITPLARELADTARRDYADGVALIAVGRVAVHRDAVIVTPTGDVINAVRALLVAVDVDGVDALTAVEDADAVGVPVADAIADVYRDAVNGFEIVENVDGSAHAVTASPVARPVTDTATVTVRHSDGTVAVIRQTSDEVHAVIRDGHRRLLTAVADGVLADYVDDVDADTVGELPKFPTA